MLEIDLPSEKSTIEGQKSENIKNFLLISLQYFAKANA